MDEELQLFQEDANEQLQHMENALLEASEGTSDKELIGSIFRAMHTIKGTAGMFAFEEIVRFTHVAENLLDKVRAGEIVFDSGLSVLFIQVKDYTQSLVNIRSQGKMPDSSVLQEGETLQQALLNIQNNEITPNAPPVFSSDQTLWRVHIRFSPDFLHSGMDILAIFKFFTKLGTIVSNAPLVDKLPPFDTLDPMTTYLGFDLLFRSSCSKADIEEIFEFVEDDVELEITPQQEEVSPSVVTDQTSQTEEITPKKETQVQAKTPPIQSSTSSYSLRVDSQKIDDLINKMSEMVIKNAQITNYATLEENETLEEMTNEMSTLLEEVRDGVMNVRLVQVKDSFVKYRRIVNDTAKKLGKKINFVIEGEETELDKSVIEKLSDPLTHMIRNAIDHGIETPQERKKRGKTEEGTVWLRAYPDAGAIIIELEDNGGGINKEAVEAKAISNGIIPKDHGLSDNDIYKLIFAAGLSTASQVSDLSGRGVGMDVVKRNIEELRGIINVQSTLGKGTKITVQLPLTLAIIDGFLVQAGKTKYIIPLEMIAECLEYTSEIASRSGNTINVRGDVLPLLHVRQFFNDPLSQEELENRELRENIVIVRFGSSLVGLLVEELHGEQQTVIKSLGAMFEHTPGISGGSLLGSGEVALIFDIPKLIEYRASQGRLA